MRLRLLSYNIRHGGLGRQDAIASVVARSEPDVVLLQEASVPSVVERLAQMTGLRAHGSRPGVSVAFLSRHPVRSYTWTQPRWAHRAFLEVVLESSALRI